MSGCVVDASVAAAAFFQERHAADAHALLASGGSLHAPDLIVAEFGNVVWKRCRGGEVSEEEASGLMTGFLKLPLQIASSRELIDVALELAIRTDRTVYDCLYLALAIKIDGVLVTCDKRFVNALASGPLADHVAAIDRLR